MDAGTPQSMQVASARELRGAWTPLSVRLGAKALMRFVAWLLLVGVTVAGIVLAVRGAYHMKMFTLWSYTLTWAFFVVLNAALYVEHGVLTAVLLLLLPLVLGSTLFVMVAIIIIIANDHAVLLSAINKFTLSEVHTADWIEHAGPPFAMMLTLVVTLPLINHLLLRTLRRARLLWQWLYWLYWMNATLVLLLIYQSIWNIDKTYPTSFNEAERILLAVGILWAIMGLAWLIIAADYDLSDFRATPLLTPDDLVPGRVPAPPRPEWVVPPLEQLRHRIELS